MCGNGTVIGTCSYLNKGRREFKTKKEGSWKGITYLHAFHPTATSILFE